MHINGITVECASYAVYLPGKGHLLLNNLNKLCFFFIRKEFYYFKEKESLLIVKYIRISILYSTYISGGKYSDY